MRAPASTTRLGAAADGEAGPSGRSGCSANEVHEALVPSGRRSRWQARGAAAAAANAGCGEEQVVPWPKPGRRRLRTRSARRRRCRRYEVARGCTGCRRAGAAGISHAGAAAAQTEAPAEVPRGRAIAAARSRRPAARMLCQRSAPAAGPVASSRLPRARRPSRFRRAGRSGQAGVGRPDTPRDDADGVSALRGGDHERSIASWLDGTRALAAVQVARALPGRAGGR